MSELCDACYTYDKCPHDHKGPRCCPDYEWDGCYTADEEANLEED